MLDTKQMELKNEMCHNVSVQTVAIMIMKRSCPDENRLSICIELYTVWLMKRNSQSEHYIVPLKSTALSLVLIKHYKASRNERKLKASQRLCSFF